MAKVEEKSPKEEIKVKRYELKGKKFVSKAWKKHLNFYRAIIALGFISCVFFGIHAGIADEWDTKYVYEGEWSKDDLANGLVVDSDGNVIFAGWSNNSDDDTVGILVKINPKSTIGWGDDGLCYAGAQVWEVNDIKGACVDVAIDSEDNPYVAYANDGNMTLEKFTSDGESDWKHKDDTGHNATGVAVDSEDNVYLMGTSLTSTRVNKYNSDGDYKSGFTYPQKLEDFDVDDDGNIYGVYNSTGGDITITKLDGAGSAVWGRSWTLKDYGSFNHTAKYIAIDEDKNTYISGYVNDTEEEAYIAFLAKFDDTGKFKWSATGEKGTIGGQIAVDENGVFVIFVSDSSDTTNMLYGYDSDGELLAEQEKDIAHGGEDVRVTTDNDGTIYVSVTTSSDSASESWDVWIETTSNTVFSTNRVCFLDLIYKIITLVVTVVIVSLIIFTLLVRRKAIGAMKGQKLKNKAEENVKKAVLERERQEAELKAKQEAERKERERLEAERRAKEEAERKERERQEAERKEQIRVQKKAEIQQRIIPPIEKLLTSKDYAGALKALDSLIAEAKSYDVQDMVEWAENRKVLASTLDKLVSLFSISENVNLNDVAGILEMNRTALLNKLLEWGKLFDVRIDGDMLRIKSQDVGNLLNLLDDSYKDWGSDKKKTMKKD